MSSWLNISMDAVHVNGQKSKRYWQRVWSTSTNTNLSQIVIEIKFL